MLTHVMVQYFDFHDDGTSPTASSHHPSDLDLDDHELMNSDESDGSLMIHLDLPNTTTTATDRLPLTLPRPAHLQPVDVEALDCGHSLQGIPRGYIADRLRAIGSELLQASATARLVVPSSSPSLPDVVRVECDGEDALPYPTHVLAIHGSDDDTRTLVLPAHGLIYAFACTALPHLALLPSPASEWDDGAPVASTSTSSPSSSSLTLPVVHLQVPSITAFPLLHAYLTTQSSSHLLTRLLPTLGPSHHHDLLSIRPPSPPPTLAHPTHLAHHLARTIPITSLHHHLRLVHGVWGNAVALGVADPTLWQAMDCSWAVLVGALAMAKAATKRAAPAGASLGSDAEADGATRRARSC